MKKLLYIYITLFNFLPLYLSAQRESMLMSTIEESGEYFTAVDSCIKKVERISVGHPDSAIRILNRLFLESTRYQNQYGIAQALLHTGNIFLVEKNDIQSALYYYRMAYPYCTNNIRESFVQWSNCMGSAFIALGQFDSAMFHIYRGLRMNMVKERAPYNFLSIKLNANIGFIHTYIDEYDKALFYLKKAESIALSKSVKQSLANIYIGLSTVYFRKANYANARLYLDKITELNLPLTNRNEGIVYSIYGYIYLKEKQPEKAIPYMKKAASLDKKNINYIGNFNGLIHIGLAYLSRGSYSRAEFYLKAALAAYSPSEPPQHLISLYVNLNLLYKTLGKYKQAHHYLTLETALRDSINKVDKTNYINKLETLYRTASKDKEIVQKQAALIASQQKLNTKNTQILGIIAGALILLLFNAFLFQRQRLKLQRVKTMEEQQKNSQLKAAIEAEEKERSRIGRQLHDDVMIELAITKLNLAALPNEFPEIKRTPSFNHIEHQLNKTGIKIRQTAHTLMPDALVTQGLVPAIHYFCHGISKTTPIRVSFQHFGKLPELPTDIEVNLYRIVQELIQNVVKHAAATEVLIQLYSREQVISLTVDDNGKGIADPGKAEQGMGIKSIRSRLKIMNGVMEIQSVQPKGTSVHIEFVVPDNTA